MKIAIRQLFLLVALFMSAPMWGQYNPDNPPEPGTPNTLIIQVTPEEGGDVLWDNHQVLTPNYPYSIEIGRSVRLTAQSKNNFRFLAWSKDGIVISTNRQIDFLMEENVVLTAHFEYAPGNPGEPDEPDIPVYSRLYLSCYPSTGGTLTPASGNRYEVGNTVTIEAKNNNNFTFISWTENGEIISTAKKFNYKIKEYDSYLVANFEYTPGSPGEPDVARLFHKLTIEKSPTGGGSVYPPSGNSYQYGSVVPISTTTNDYYSLQYWRVGNDTVSTSLSFNYVMPDSDVTMVAHYKYNYNPGNPGEPGGDTNSHHSIYGMTENAVSGETIDYPIYLENTSPVTGIFIDVTFPEGFIIDLDNVKLGDRTANHELDIHEVADTANCYRFKVIGEDYFVGDNGKVLEIPVTIPDTVAKGRNYPVILTHGVILKNDTIIPQTAIRVRSGNIYIEKFTEDGLYARFSYDRFQDQVQFKNLSSGNAKTYLWDFGDGTQSTEENPKHVYSSAGNYSVKLTVTGEVDTDAAIEYLYIDDESSWRVNGQFYLADEELGARHFKTIEELFTALNRGTVNGNVVVNVLSGTTSDYDLTSNHLSLMQAFYDKFKDNSYTLTFSKRGNERNPVIQYGSSLQSNTAEDIEKVLNTCDSFKYRGVEMRVCGIMVDAQALVDLTEQTINSGARTKPVNFSLISPDLTFAWSLKNMSENVTGCLNSGTGSLPAMTIVNENEGNYTLEYEINASASGVSFYHFTYHIHVVPALVGLFNDMSPAKDAVLDSTTVTLSWNPILNAKYDVYLWNANNDRPSTPVAEGTTAIRYTSKNFLQHGNSYKWQVIAYNGFQEVVSDTMNFSINNLPNLHICSLDVSEPAAGQPITIQWKVQNDGTGPTGQVQWKDYIWLVQDVLYGTIVEDVSPERHGSENNTHFLTEVPNVKALGPNESYENSVEVTLPERLYGDFYILVTTDMYNVTEVQWNAVGGTPPHPYEPTQDGTGYPHIYAYTAAYYNKVYEENETSTFSDNFFYKKMHINVPPLADLQVSSVRAEVIPTSYIWDSDFERAFEATIPTPVTAAGLAHNTEMYSGKKLKVTATVINKGGAPIEEEDWRSVLYISSSSKPENGGLHAMASEETKKTSLEPNQSIDVEFNMWLPYEWHGDTYFHVYTDINNQVYELANTVNNWGSSDKYDVLLTPGADFEPRNLSVPSKISSANSFEVKYDVKNIGPGIPYRNSWVDKIYLSKNKNGIDQNATCVASINRSGHFESQTSTLQEINGIVMIPAEDFLYRGDDYSVSETVQPSGLSSGTYYIYVKVDADDGILELDGEENNVIRSGAIEYVEPDLAVELISISQDTLSSGDIVAFSWKVKNVGNADLEEVKLKDAFYATVNQDGSNPILFGTAENTIWLAAGAEKVLYANITIPKSQYLDGFRYVFVKTNYKHDIKEPNLNNNQSDLESEVARSWFKYLEEPKPNVRNAIISVSSIDIIGQITSGSSVKVKCNVKNMGDIPIDIDVSRDIYLTNANGVGRENCEIINEEGSLVGLLPGESTTLTTTVIIPNIRGGERRIYVQLDKANVLNSPASSNVAWKTVTMLGNIPNIDIVPISIPDTIMTSVDTNLKWGLKNIGDWKTDAGNTLVLLSNDDKYDYGDNLLANLKPGSVEAGNTLSQSSNINILDRFNGRRYIVIVYYEGDRILESTVRDTISIPVMVALSPCPDLQVSSLQTNEILRAGETITINYTVTNNGDHATKQALWGDAFYLSPSTILDKNNAIQLGSRTHNGVLQVGDSYNAEVTYTIPSFVQGNYMLFVVTDDANAIYETEENNNHLNNLVYVNGSSDRPADLMISHLSIPTTIIAGEPITVKYDIYNVGEFEAIGTLRDVIYLSKDTIWDINDQMVGVVSGEVDIASGKKITRQATGSIINMVEGTYYVIVKTNSTHAIAESTDTNNVILTPSPSNLVFSTLTLGEQAQVNNAGYFRLRVPGGYEGKTIGVFLDHPEEATVGLYTAHDEVPSTAHYDLASFEPKKNKQEVLISDVAEGDYYILAQDLANVVNSEGYEFKLNAPPPTRMTLTAKEVPFGATSLSLTEGGTGGWVTTDVRGALFDSIMDFRLISDSHMIPAELTKYKGRTISRVTFNLHDVETGIYDVETELPDGTRANLPQGFHVIPGTSVGLGVRIESETEVHEGSFTPISIAYANGGTTDIEIVEIMVVIDYGYLSTTIQGLDRYESVIHIKPGGEPDSRGYVIIPPGTHDVVSAFLMQTVAEGWESKITVYVVK